MYFQEKGRAKIKVGKTAVIKKTRAPKWTDEVFELVLPEPKKLRGASVLARNELMKEPGGSNLFTFALLLCSSQVVEM